VCQRLAAVIHLRRHVRNIGLTAAEGRWWFCGQ
jgi:hypothetical protein